MNHARYLRLLAQLALFLATCSACGRARADIVTVDFESLASPPGVGAASSSFGAANGGSDVVDGIAFDDNFLVFEKSYSAALGGNDPFGNPNGSYAITNGDGNGGTGAFPPGLDSLMISTPFVLTSAYFAANDYGNGSFGADQVTVTAFGAGGDLASASLALDDALGNPITTLTKLDTSGFAAFAGQITGYRIDREVTSDFDAFGAGGNYVADDFTFVRSVPEPASIALLAIGSLALALRSRRRGHASNP